MITAGDLKVYSRFSINCLVDMEIMMREGCHGELVLRGYLSDGANGTDLSSDTIMVTGKNEDGKEEILFHGFIQETHVFHENGVSQIILKAESGSMRMDKMKRSRSFQDTSLSCSEIMQAIAAEYGGAIVCENSSVKIGKPMIQYEETDWEFCKRLAGRMGWGLFSSLTTTNPVLYIGIPKGKKAEFPADEYHCCVDSEYYKQRKEGEIPRAEFLYYKVESEKNYEIGDSAWFQGQKRYIFEKRAELKGNILCFSYKLGGKCRVMKGEQPNKKITGISLSGTVQENERQTVYLKLDIDGNNGKAVYPYPWSPATGNLAYCMPQPGSKVYLYFPDCHEENAIVVHSVHKGKSGFEDTQNRGFETKHGKQMQLYAESISFQSTTAAGEQLFILGQDDLRVKSGRGRTVVTGKEKVTLCAPVITFTTPQGVNQYKVERYALEKEENIKPKGSRNPATGGDSSFSLQYEFNGLARQGVMAGTQYERYFAFQDEPSYEKDYSTGWKILAGIAAAVLVGVAIGALALIAGPVAAAIIGISAAQLAVGTGIITAGIGIIATLGTYNNDKRNGTTSSIGEYVGNAYTAAATVGGALVGAYLSLTGAETLAVIMTGGSVAVPAFGTVFSVETLTAIIALGTTGLSSLNLLYQLDNLRRFLAGEKALKEPTGDPWYDTKKAWTEILMENVTMMALQNPRTYGGYYSRLDTPLLDAAGTSESTALTTQNPGALSVVGNQQVLLPMYNVPLLENSVINPVNGGGGYDAIKVGKEDLDALRNRLGISKTNTIAVGKTNVKGLENIIFEGQSPKVRNEAGLPDLDEIWSNRNFKAPGNNPLFTRHAEEVIANEFDKAVIEAGIKPQDVTGVLKIHQSNPSGVCRKCIQGLSNDTVSAGVLKQLSLKYPNLRIEVTSEILPNVKVTGRSSFIIQNGKYVE